MSAAPEPITALASDVACRVLLVVADSAVSQAAIDRTSGPGIVLITASDRAGRWVGSS